MQSYGKNKSNINHDMFSSEDTPHCWMDHEFMIRRLAKFAGLSESKFWLQSTYPISKVCKNIYSVNLELHAAGISGAHTVCGG